MFEGMKENCTQADLADRAAEHLTPQKPTAAKRQPS